MQESERAVKRCIGPDEGIAEPHGSYSQGIVYGSTLYVSGQAAFDSSTGEIVSQDFGVQAQRTIENLLDVAAAAGAGPSDAVRVDVHLSDLEDFSAFDEVYRRYFSEPYPTRMTVGSRLIPGLLIEMDGLFAVPSRNVGHDTPTS